MQKLLRCDYYGIRIPEYINERVEAKPALTYKPFSTDKSSRNDVDFHELASYQTCK